MPYLHFETNEGRINLSNAVRRAASDNASSVLETTNLPVNIKDHFTNDDSFSDSDVEEETPKGKTALKLQELKGVPDSKTLHA